MRIVKAVILAFSMYSNIPVPQLAWKDEDMRYVLCFFPWIGIVIGACVFLWRLLCEKWEIGLLAYTLVGTAVPVLVTGGFHVDGFMDTMDAFRSYQPRERKLEILKDSHIGAFSVIMLALYGLIYMAAFSEIRNMDIVRIVCAGFVLSRILSGIGVATFPPAKKDGLFHLFADRAQKTAVRIALCAQMVLCIGFMLWQSPYCGGFVILAAFAALGYYYRRCIREFGGMTGDTAGYFILLCEGCMMTAAAVFQKIWM